APDRAQRWYLEQQRRELAAVVRGKLRIVREDAEDVDHDLARSVADAVFVASDQVEQPLERSFMLAVRRERFGPGQLRFEVIGRVLRLLLELLEIGLPLLAQFDGRLEFLGLGFEKPAALQLRDDLLRVVD